MKKRYQKILATALLFALTFSLTSCGNNSGGGQSATVETGETLTLALRAGTYADVIKECLPEFEQQYGVTCEVLELEEDELHSGIADDAAANPENGAYDLVMVDGSWKAEFTASGVLANLTEMGYEFDDDIIPATTDVCYYDTEIYLAPFYGNVTVLLYNKDLVKKAGYSADEIRSLEDMQKICDSAKKAGKSGFLYRGDTENNTVVDFLPILLSYGGWVIDENKHPTVDTPQCKAALACYLDLIGTGKALVKDDLIAAIDSGDAAMGIGWPGWYVPTDESAAAYTALSGKAKDHSMAYSANVYGVWTIGIPANGSHPEMSLELLQYLMDPEVQKGTVASGGVPCRYSSLQDKEVLRQYPQYEVVCDALENGVYRPLITEWTDFYTVLGTEINYVINGEKEIDEALEDAQVRLEIVMGLQEYV